ncbi:MAG TPA: methylated-DNA--[protein]-cysteine S-methyltransferase [Burkholderiales bacterium]|nr:methylated-DNA--[protein]-cysteine S-methyltransferase [Burkholderiales bacterium]
MQTEYQAILPTPFGALGVLTQDDAVREIVYLPPETAPLAPQNALAERACAQLQRYVADPDYIFDLPLCTAGTPFQRAVWREICAVPRGQVTRYADIARKLSSAARAVGQACGANPFPPVVPCHRVVSANGLGGFANHTDGYLMATKRWLLRHEGWLANPLL